MCTLERRNQDAVKELWGFHNESTEIIKNMSAVMLRLVDGIKAEVPKEDGFQLAGGKREMLTR